ncbi:arylsulfatase [Thalassotalea loyana]|uniref:Arylsulfatase n=1 Tax=Thalassotalea loyana TaxID=280483 RepID=A0ABQ6HD30_9GAMM|nr:arylsulfatase [Thalassotalea loyana]GLX85998.1 arylsulfatase [Thalassotalea loyana]
MSIKKNLSHLALGISLIAASGLANATTDTSRPNILAIWGDDIGVHNISAYNHGIMGYHTPNIDRLANEGAMFTDAYAQQSCTAGRAAFMMGQQPFRTGMLTIGMPGSSHGIPDWTPTIADVLKNKGYMTAQHGKNHFGDQNNHLPTEHGFDQFYGNLYHLNAEEEPETYYYPKDPDFRKSYGPRGVIKSFADGRIEDTGPMTRKRMETADEEFLAETLKFIDKAHQEKKPFFIWHNTTRMHVWTRLKEEAKGRTGIGLYPDGMVEHDDHVGILLDKLDNLGIADNTIVMYSTDNGAETVTWPDGGITPFHGEKGTTWEGGFRVPLIVKWPGKIKPGSTVNGIVSHEDWMPTFASAAGIKDLPSKMKQGYHANGKDFRVHLDGYDLSDYLSGGTKESPRDAIFYFAATGQLNAVRWENWKAHFAVQEGAINQAVRTTPAWPVVINLKSDPYEKMWDESQMYLRWYADNMWLFVPLQKKVKEFMGTIKGYPFQPGSSLSASGIDYEFLVDQQMKKTLAEVDAAVKKLSK